MISPGCAGSCILIISHPFQKHGGSFDFASLTRRYAQDERRWKRLSFVLSVASPEHSEGCAKSKGATHPVSLGRLVG